MKVTLQVGTKLPDTVAKASVVDHAGVAKDLDAMREGAPAVFVFLRHFGCTACTEHVSLLMPALAPIAALGVRVVFVGNGKAQYIDGFVERNGVPSELARVVTDPSLRVFDAAGMVRSRMSTFGPKALLHLGRSIARGHKQTSIEGEPLQQGGVIVVAADGTIVYAHADRFAGDHAPTDDVVAAAKRAAGVSSTG
jgi:peroxiredoxin